MGYLCANFSLPRPLCSRVRPDVRDRQTDRRQTKALFNGGGDIIMLKQDKVENVEYSLPIHVQKLMHDVVQLQ